MNTDLYDFYSDYGSDFGGYSVNSSASVFGAFVGLLMVVAVIALIFAAATYVLSGIAYYKLAKARSMPHPWLSWIPVVNSYLIGKISDDIANQQGEKANRGAMLLILDIVRSGFYLIALITYLTSAFSLVADILRYADYLDYMTEHQVWAMLEPYLMPIIISLVFLILGAAVSIWHFVIYIMAHNTMYKAYAPNSATAFLVLSILGPLLLSVNFLPPIFILTFYKKIPASTMPPQQPGVPYGGQPYQNQPYTTQTPYSQSAQTPYSQPAQTPYSQPAQTPYSQPAQTPYSQPAQTPYSQPAQTPYSQPAQTPYSQPAQTPYSQPAEPEPTPDTVESGSTPPAQETNPDHTAEAATPDDNK